MNGNKILLDTNAVIAVFNGDEKLNEILQDKKRFLPSVVCGELYYGALNSKRQKQNIETLERFLLQCYVLTVDLGTARKFGEIRVSLKKKGKPIPDNDIWIAALASQHALPLATEDGHFEAVEGLDLVKW